MMIQAVLGNPHHPEYGVATIPFPIPVRALHGAAGGVGDRRRGQGGLQGGGDRQLLYCP